VPADPSSPIPAALAHLTRTGPRELKDAEAPHLLAYLAAVPDPRATRGRRHPLVAILGLAAAAVLVTLKQAHYRFTVKANQPTLLARCARMPWHRVAVADRTRDRGHGRVELRILKAVCVRHFGFPHAAQVIQVTRKTRQLHTTKWRAVTVYAITSLPFEQARPARLADLLRGHWAIEALHHLRDVTFAEDASQVRTGSGPSVMAALRNLAIGVLCRAGPVNVAAALRQHARDPHRPLATLGITLGSSYG
jgi:predicted transposase YbfD/YdcC